MSVSAIKICGRCSKPQPLTEFNKRSDRPGKLQSYCRTCRTAYQKTWWEENAEAKSDERQAYRVSKVQERRDYAKQHRLGKYSLTLADFDQLLQQQNGRCAICFTDEPGAGGRFKVDHDHRCCPAGRSCGRSIRGLLCHACNVALGLLGDDLARLSQAVSYLEAYETANNSI